jgi:DNA-binding response OmpR family regulator
LVDDDVELCHLLRRFLVDEGFSTDLAGNGCDGVAQAMSGKYSLIVLDVMMPDMSGFEVLRRIRLASRTPILMLTARGDTCDRVLGLEMGADDYLLAIIKRRSVPDILPELALGELPKL